MPSTNHSPALTYFDSDRTLPSAELPSVSSSSVLPPPAPLRQVNSRIVVDIHTLACSQSLPEVTM